MRKTENCFVLNNNILFNTNNFNLENNLEDCFCVKKSISSEVYISEKKNNKWIRKDEYIDDYDLLMNFIINNKSNIIFIRGFDRAFICKLVSDFNKIKNTNIVPIKFKDIVEQAKYERHLIAKKNRMKKLHQKLENTNEIQTAEDYMKILNSVFNEKKHTSRKKIIKLKRYKHLNI